MMKLKLLFTIGSILFFSFLWAETSISYSGKKSPVIDNAKAELADFIRIAKLKNVPSFRLSINPDLAEEQWFISRSAGADINISGGSARGVLYGVYEFLETIVGIRFYGPAHTHIPQEAKYIPAEFEYTGKPFIKIRFISLGNNWDADYRWYARNRVHGPRGKYEFGSFSPYGSPYRCHTYGLYTTQKDFPNKPESYALQQGGDRPAAKSGSGPGQPCLSNPEVINFFKRKLCEFIEKNRATAKEKGRPAPVVYNISANDNDGYCVCELCKKAWERTGGPGGLDLEFVNKLAETIEVRYPEIVLECFAYKYSENPEKIKARDNVRVQLAQLGREWSNGERNTMLSLKHPSNEESLKKLHAWSQYAKRLAVWDYGIIYSDSFPTPYTKVRSFAETFSEYYAAGVESIYLESENNGSIQKEKVAFPQSFCDLKNYIFCRFMLDARIDVEAIINQYMEDSYGAAATYMLQYLKYLEERQNAVQVMNAYPAEHRMHFDYDFFTKAETLLSAAETAVKHSPEKLFRISRERFNVDYAMLGTWRKHLEGRKFPLTLEQVEARLAANEESIVKACYSPMEHTAMLAAGAKRRNNLINSIKSELSQLPDFLKNKKIVSEYFSDNFNASSAATIVNDDEAFQGKTFMLPDISVGHFTLIHERPFELGVYSNDKKKILAQKIFDPSELPQDEKYHWHGFRSVEITARCRMWGHSTWALTPVRVLHEVFDPSNPAKKFDVWISYKLTGPAYVEESDKENAAYIDRVIVTEHDP